MADGEIGVMDELKKLVGSMKSKTPEGEVKKTRYTEALERATALQTLADAQKAEIAALKAASPAKGSRVLSADEATAFDAYVALGKPEEIAPRLTQGQADRQVIEKGERLKTYESVAKDHKLDPSVFADLFESKGLKVEHKAVTRDGKPAFDTQVVQGDAKVPLDKFIDENLSPYKPALGAREAARSPYEHRPTGSPPTPRHQPAPPAPAGKRDEDLVFFDLRAAGAGNF